MTQLDRATSLPGYFKSPWPVECGGNRRQKAAVGGLWVNEGKAHVTTRRDDRWHVMAIRRGPGESLLEAPLQHGQAQNLMAGYKGWI